jgi:hypothetical protein
MIVSMLAAAALGTAAAQPPPYSGMYDGSRMEMAVGLELQPDGHFRYGMSYGALDEGAEGVWSLRDGRIYLTSDPVTAPQIALEGEQDGPAGTIRILLDSPDLTPQLFEAAFTGGDGGVNAEQLGEEGLELPIEGEGPVSVRLVLPMFDVAGPPVALAGTGGRTLRFRFDANDLGKVAFSATPVTPEEGGLVLERHGQSIHFRRVEDGGE